MNDVAELQRRWLAALLAPDSAAAAVTAELSGGIRAPQQAFALYVNSVRGAIKASIEDSFPAAVAALGPRFAALMPTLLATQPPTSADLSRYDATFVAWLVHTQDEVADLARFEWAAERGRRVRATAGLSVSALQSHNGPLRLNQHITLFATERHPPVAVAGAHFWALAGGESPQRRPLGRAEYAFLAGLEGAGAPLTEALRWALFVDQQFDPLPVLEWLIAVGGVVEAA